LNPDRVASPNPLFLFCRHKFISFSSDSYINPLSELRAPKRGWTANLSHSLELLHGRPGSNGAGIARRGIASRQEDE
jgi:hypothetical protein